MKEQRIPITGPASGLKLNENFGYLSICCLKKHLKELKAFRIAAWDKFQHITRSAIINPIRK